MFASQAVKALPDLSLDISDPSDWQYGSLKRVDYHLDMTAIATEPVSGLFAVGTSRGLVYVYGSPGVYCEIKLSDPPGLRVKFLQFAASAFKLLCIDDHNRLHVWDLAGEGRPKLQRITGFGQSVNALVTSPSHTHAFIALANGQIKTYDLLCLRISGYEIPNLWTLQQETSLSSSFRDSSGTTDMVIDMAIHPRDLNLVFIAYEGGVLLCDLKEQKPVRTFEMNLPPGAPGGSGYHAKDILHPRHLQVTALAVHPSGHLLAVGYIDGTIGYWSLEDEDKPLMLRTIDSPGDEDLSAVDAEKLESIMSAPQSHPPEPPREPIFKLAWSGFLNSPDPRGGDTVLTVLGGITIDSPPCVTSLLLPPLQPPAPPATTSPRGEAVALTTYPEIRAAICKSLTVKNVHVYTTAGTVQDFILFPRASPHFSGSYDPSTILIISESDVPDVRVCEGYTFPPPAFNTINDTPQSPGGPASPSQRGDALEPDDVLADELQSTLQSMAMSDEPSPVRLPPYLWTVLGELLVKVDKHAYDTLVRDKLGEISGEAPFPVKGGLAWSVDSEGHMKYTKKQPHRILMSHLRDLSIRFMDLSSQLLDSTGPDSPLAANFPSPIPRLTIELAPILLDPTVGVSGTMDFDPQLTKQHIESVHFAPESLECVVVLRNGAVILHRLDVPTDAENYGQQTLPDAELVSLSHMHVRKGLRYSPVFAIKPDKARGQVTSCALSDVGFLAIAYSFGLLLVIDLRGPRVLLRDSHDSSGSLFRHADPEPIQSLTWTCCGLSSNSRARMRLMCIAASGKTTVYTLDYKVPSTWVIDPHLVTVDGPVHPIPGASFVLNAKTGNKCLADRSGLATVLENGRPDGQYIWVAAGTKGVRCWLDIDKERIAKVDWPSKVGTVLRVEVVQRLDSQALVAFTSQGNVLIYTLPHLEPIHTLQFYRELSAPPSTDDSGDYITHDKFPAPSSSLSPPIFSTELHTLFVARRAEPYAPPLVDFTRGRGTVPSQPQPISLGPASMMSSVLGYLGSLSVASAGDQIDALLAGPDRPIPQPLTKPVRPAAKTSESATSASSSQSATASAAAGMSAGVSDLYNRLGTAITERGEMLGGLQQSLDSVEQGSKNMVAQAKKLAAQQTAKGWFGW